MSSTTYRISLAASVTSLTMLHDIANDVLDIIDDRHSTSLTTCLTSFATLLDIVDDTRNVSDDVSGIIADIDNVVGDVHEVIDDVSDIFIDVIVIIADIPGIVIDTSDLVKDITAFTIYMTISISNKKWDRELSSSIHQGSYFSFSEAGIFDYALYREIIM
jgi:hypothetical protein